MLLDSLANLNFTEFLILQFLLTPIIAFIWFLISLILFLVAPKATPARKRRLVHFIVSGSISFVTFIAIGSLVALFFIGLSGM